MLKGHIPVRTCTVCRAKKGKKELARFTVRADGFLLEDIAQKTEGRGIYICKTESCRAALRTGKSIKKHKRYVTAENATAQQ